MKQGKTLQELAAELTRQSETRKDFMASTEALTVNTNGETMLALRGREEQLPINDWAHGQIAAHLQIPRPYYDRLRENESPVVKQLFDETVNTLFRDKPEQRFVRTLDGRVRSFHSNRFRPYDNYKLAESILPAFAKAECVVMSCEVTDKRLYLKVVSPKITLNVKKGDVVQAGLVISNSEIGAGSLKVEPLLYTLSCTNGMIAESAAFRKIHSGKALEGAGADAIEFFSDETRKLTDEAVFMQIKDIVQGTLSDEGFAVLARKFSDSQDRKITAEPFEVAEIVQKQYGFREEEKRGVLSHLLQGNDLSQYGLINAVTRYAQDVESYDRATELERVGGEILELNKNDWAVIAEARH